MDGFGTRQQAPSFPQSQQGFGGMGGDTYNVGNKDIDTEYGKHVLNVAPFKKVFYELFAGWRDVEVDQVKIIGDMKKTVKVREVYVDEMSRTMNEAGASYIYSAVMALIAPASTTSKLTEMQIWNNWHGCRIGIRKTLINQTFFPRLKCIGDGGRCTFVTSSSSYMREHFRIFRHSEYYKTINPFSLDIDRIDEVMTKVCNMGVLTRKATDGFTFKETMENYVSTASSQQMQLMMNQEAQQRGIISRLTGGLVGGGR